MPPSKTIASPRICQEFDDGTVRDAYANTPPNITINIPFVAIWADKPRLTMDRNLSSSLDSDHSILRTPWTNRVAAITANKALDNTFVACN